MKGVFPQEAGRNANPCASHNNSPTREPASLQPEGFRERPILFSAEMVRAILEGRKTQTRRIVRPQPCDMTPCGGTGENWVTPSICTGPCGCPPHMQGSPDVDRCPYGKPGDRLWVRETWAIHRDYDRLPPSKVSTIAKVHYLVDGPKPKWCGRIRSSRFMPRWASRLTLEIESVSVERLQDISYADGAAEGFPFSGRPFATFEEEKAAVLAWYIDLWESINGKGSWDENPWVWKISFRPQTGNLSTQQATGLTEDSNNVELPVNNALSSQSVEHKEVR